MRQGFLAILGSVLMLLASGSAFAAAAYVHDLRGTATVAAPNGASRALHIGDLIDSGSTVRTAANSGATLKFEDGQVMVLRDNTAFQISDYAYDKQKISASRAAFNLIAGGLRFITGVIGATNHNSFRLTAANVTIGIRGSDVFAEVDPVTAAVTAVVNAGAAVLTSADGTVTLAPGMFSTASRTGRPTAPRPLTQAAQNVVRAVAALRAQPVPLNTPTVLAKAADAARAQFQARQADEKANAAKAAAAAPGADDAAKRAALQAEADAKSAHDKADQSLKDAVDAARDAMSNATKNGGATPPPPAPSTGQSVSQFINDLGATGAGPTTSTGQTTGTPAGSGAGGAGGGGGGGPIASPN